MGADTIRGMEQRGELGCIACSIGHPHHHFIAALEVAVPLTLQALCSAGVPVAGSSVWPVLSSAVVLPGLPQASLTLLPFASPTQASDPSEPALAPFLYSTHSPLPFASPTQASEPALAPFLYSTILAHATLEKSLAFLLSNKLCSPSVLGAVQLMGLVQASRGGGEGMRGERRRGGAQCS